MDFFNKIEQGFTNTIIKPSETFFNKTIPEKIVGHSLPPSITGVLGIHTGTVTRPISTPISTPINQLQPTYKPQFTGKPITHTVIKSIDDPNTNNYTVPLIIGGVLIVFMVMKN
jgi:hypothetical protein